MSPTQRARPARPGFTLIELLVVLAILAVLMALLSAAVMRFMQAGPRTATRSALRTTKSKMSAQMKSVRAQANGEPIPISLLPSIYALLTPAATSQADPRVRAKYIELKMMQAFPQTFAEVFNPLLPWPDYQRELMNNNVAPSGTTAPFEAAVCMRMALQMGPRESGTNPEDFGPIGTKLFDLGNGKQVLGLVDGWGSPLLFSRNPAGQPALTLVIMSWGPDRLPGVALPVTDLSPTNPTQYDDNLSTLNLP